MSEKDELQQQAVKNGNSKENETASDRETRIFAEAPVGKAVASMIIPTIVSQIILVIYNLADTWYVGLTENAAAVAAVSLCNSKNKPPAMQGEGRSLDKSMNSCARIKVGLQNHK